MPLKKISFKNTIGFTMIELLTVITIMSVLISLVGPATLKFINKAQAQSEFIQLKNDLKKISYLSFVSATIHNINFNQHQALVIKSDNSPIELTFEHLHFHQQKINFNRRGFATPELLTVSVNNKKKTINLFKLVEGTN